MRLARRASFATFLMLVLTLSALAQTQRSETDPRNQAPTVGTGGPPGGPTGLFTIYDGSTLRRGEFTFSFAYSNFDRDPGNVDITEVPVSFQIGINDHLELFFNTDMYRGIKVNSPLNLSGFYLPNSQVAFGTNALGSPPAIILSPSGPNVGTLAGLAVFRPPFCPNCAAAFPTGPGAGPANNAFNTYYLSGQPFVQFPFVGGPGPNFGLGPGGIVGGIGTFFGFPGFNATLGASANPNSGNYGPADNFPGIGSAVGGILPGVVLATTTFPFPAPGTPLAPNNAVQGQLTVPATFTIAPTYLPDAPFINRLYGQTAFSTYTIGGKWLLTDVNNPLGFALVGFYRWYGDHADDLPSFTQVQRGASPAGDIGDFGLGAVLSGRLSRSANLSVNATYILNSNPSGEFPAGEFVLLDRPDEFQFGLGIDLPINKHFQPIGEFRGIRYVGGRTPNAFENNPLEFLAGVRIFPRRWWGMSFAYRRHLNQQDDDSFDDVNFNTTVTSSTVIIPPRPGFTAGGTFTVPARSAPATVGGFPRGFVQSDDPNGFLFQIWLGHRNARAPEILPNQAPVVNLTASSSTVTKAANCQAGFGPNPACTPTSDQIQLTANASDPDGDTLLYTYSTTGGQITGDGPNVTWNLAGVTPGTYTATVEVDDGCGCVSFSSTTVTVNECDCVPLCPTITVDCPTQLVEQGTPATVTANISGGPANMSLTYNWSVSAGTISGGQGTPSITVDTTGQAGQTITATVEIGGLAPECQRTASCTFTISQRLVARKFDEYGDIRFNDEKARLDNFAIQLQNEPGSTGVIVVYAARTGPAGQAQARADRAKDYLVNTRGIDANRIRTIDGGCREDLTVELWIEPQGAEQVTADAASTVPCEPRTTRRSTRRGRRGRDDE
jgi:hypothetical protein